MIRRLLLGVLSITALGTTAIAADWPQWRGPNRDGKSGDTGLLKLWPASGPKLLWKLNDAGVGYGSPAVVVDKVFLLGSNSAKQGGSDSVTCLSLKDGSKIWTKEIGTSPGNYSDGWGGGPRNTPTVDGDSVYVLGATGDLVCLKTSDGSIVWKKNLVKDFGGQIPDCGYSESVLIDGDALVCTPGKKTGMLALNKMTGESIWECKEFNDFPGYSSIMIATFGGVKQYVQQTMAQAVGVKAASGKLLWNAGEMNRGVAVIPSPIVRESSVFFTSGYGAGCELIDVSGSGDSFTATVKYKNKKFANHHGGVIEHNGLIFGHSDAGGWTCFDPVKGEEKWQDKGIGKGSVSFADGKFYCYSENAGELALVEPSDSEWKVISKFTIPGKSVKRPSQGKIWPHPVIANGVLLLRDYEMLFAYNVRGAAE